jgi:hypothetical protein
MGITALTLRKKLRDLCWVLVRRLLGVRLTGRIGRHHGVSGVRPRMVGISNWQSEKTAEVEAVTVGVKKKQRQARTEESNAKASADVMDRDDG